MAKNNYTVTFMGEYSCPIKVEAESADEALKLAETIYETTSIDDYIMEELNPFISQN